MHTSRHSLIHVALVFGASVVLTCWTFAGAKPEDVVDPLRQLPDALQVRAIDVAVVPLGGFADVENTRAVPGGQLPAQIGGVARSQHPCEVHYRAR